MSSSNSNQPHQSKEACLYKFQQFLECVLQSLGSNGDPKNTDKYFRVINEITNFSLISLNQLYFIYRNKLMLSLDYYYICNVQSISN